MNRYITFLKCFKPVTLDLVFILSPYKSGILYFKALNELHIVIKFAQYTYLYGAPLNE